MGTIRRLATVSIVLGLAVAGASASLGAADGSVSSTATRGWGPVGNLSRLEPFGVRSPLDDCTPTTCDTTAVAIDDDGNALAVWVHPEHERTALMSAFRPRNGDWRASVRVRGSLGAANPVVAFDGDGDAVVAWVARYKVRAVRRTSGGRWPAPVTVFQSRAMDAAVPRDLDLAVNGNGRAVLAWGGLRLRAAVGFSDGRWGRPRLLTPSSAGVPDAVVDRWGRATVVWGEHAGWVGYDQVMVASRDVGEPWTQPRALSRRGNLVWQPWIATQPDGDLAVAWSGQLGDAWGVRLVRKAYDRPWGTGAVLKRDTFGSLQMSMDGAGVVTLVWTNPNNETLWRVQHRPGRGWGSQVRMTRAHDVTPGDEFPLAGNAAGDLVVPWTSDRRAVKALYRSRDRGWGTRPATLSEGRGRWRLPAAAMGPGGAVVVVWLHQPAGSRLSHVQATRFVPRR